MRVLITASPVNLVIVIMADRYHRLKTQVLKQEYLDGRLAELQEMPVNADKQAMAKNYLTHVLTLGTD